MATQTAPLGLRLFLEGIEVPVIGAQVNIQQGQPAAAAIQVVPTDSALLLLPRTLVHLFYLDNEFIDPASELRADRVNRNRDDQNRFKVADEQYKLLFAGEMIGYNYSKNPTSRSMVLQCLDLSSYWDTCYQWFADYSVGGNGLTDKSHNFVAAGQYLFNNVASGTRWVIGNILNTKPANPDYAEAGGLLAGYIHLLESIGGLRPRRRKSTDPPSAGAYKAFRGVNDFFTIAELRYNLSGMIGAVAADKTSVQMFANKAFRSWLQSGMSSAGSLVSYRDVLGLVGQYIFHDVYPNPAAFYVRGGTKISQRIPQVVADTSSGSRILNQISRARELIDRVIQNLDEIASVEPFVLEARDGPVLLVEALEFLDLAVEDVKSGGSSDASRIINFVLLAAAVVRRTVTDFRILRRGDNIITVPPSVSAGMINELNVAFNNLRRVLESSSAKKSKEANIEVTSGDHLYNQLLLPETFFVVPPRCNVLFPDMYFSFTYSRNFLREVSRLSCQGGLGLIAGGGGRDSILGDHYMAPNIRDVRGKIARATVFAHGSTILPHEIHSGIIPKYEWVTDGHRWGVEAAKATGKNTEKAKINYIQRLANFQFFMHRWAARNMSAQARFNPHMVIGFPGVIIDRSTPSIGALITASSQIDSGQALLPTAYVGKVATLQHTIGQDGGTTSVAYTQCRTHRGIDDEFLGVVSREIKEGEIEEQIEVVPQDMITIAKQGQIIDDRQLYILQQYVRGRLNILLKIGGGYLSSLRADGPTDEFLFEDLSLLGVSQDDFFSLQARQGRQGEDTALLPLNISVKISITLQQGKYVKKEGAPSFEELVRPAYYSPEVWDNANISEKVYLPLLGTRAITDDEQVGDPEQFAALVTTAIENAGDIQSEVTVESEGDAVILKVDGRSVATIGLNLETGTTTETAIDGLTLLYGLLKKKNLDVQSFIDDYIKRPIANLVEILGDSDLQFDSSGEAIARADGSVPVEGFHSRAFGPYNAGVKHRIDTGEDSTQPEAGPDAFLGLIPSDQVEAFNNAGTIIRPNESKKLPPIPLYLDPRGRAQARVRSYADELTVTRGILAT